MEPTSFKKRGFLFVFCLASILEGMYSTYFVSILTTIERIYQIQSKTAGAILSATELGQIIGSLLIAYYGGRGSKPRWIASCMILTAIAAITSTSPHFMLNTPQPISGRPIIMDERSIRSSSQFPLLMMSSTQQLPSPINSDLNEPDHPISEEGGRKTTSTYSSSSLQLSTTSPSSSLSSSSSSSLSPFPSSSKTTINNEDNQRELPLCVNNNRDAKLSNGNQIRFLHLENNKNQFGGQLPPETPLETNVTASNQTYDKNATTTTTPRSTKMVFVVMFICLLGIGFGSTAITTLGIPYIDDIVSREESPLYLGATIGLRILGPALGFLLGSFCIRQELNMHLYIMARLGLASEPNIDPDGLPADGLGCWWLGPIIISLPLLLLALPMYLMARLDKTSRSHPIVGSGRCSVDNAFEDITYRAAEDHDIGGSRDLEVSHVLAVADLEVTSNGTCYSEVIDSSSREVLQMNSSKTAHQSFHLNFAHNLSLDKPVIIRESLFRYPKDQLDSWRTAGTCLVVGNYDGDIESTSFVKNNDEDDDDDDLDHLDGIASRMLRDSGFPRRKQISVSSNNSSQNHANFPTTIRPPATSSSATDGSYDNNNNMATALARLFRNKLLLLRISSNVLHILPIAGFYTFLPKYLIEHFRLQASSASAVSGLAGILFVGLGAFLGGTLIRVFRVSSHQMTRWIACSSLLYLIGMLLLMSLSCQQSQLIHQGSPEFVGSNCSFNCGCTSHLYQPICRDGISYITACHAGCRSYSIQPAEVAPTTTRKATTKLVFEHCDCGNSNNSLTVPNLQLTTGVNSEDVKKGEHQNHAHEGLCQIECSNLKYYIIVFALFTLIHASSEVGSTMLNLRCVRPSDRTLALGLITFSTSLLGSIPCSVLYGSVIDLTCVHWERAAGTQSGACLAYDNDSFRRHLHGLTATFMLLAFLVDCVICRRADGVDLYSDQPAIGMIAGASSDVVAAGAPSRAASHAKSSCSIVESGKPTGSSETL